MKNVRHKQPAAIASRNMSAKQASLSPAANDVSFKRRQFHEPDDVTFTRPGSPQSQHGGGHSIVAMPARTKPP